MPINDVFGSPAARVDPEDIGAAGPTLPILPIPLRHNNALSPVLCPAYPVPPMPAPPEVLDLVARFALHAHDYQAGDYGETELRREFLDPLFKALGWDIDNRQGHAEAYKDVIHEDAIKIGGATKAPDYCFRIGGTRKFFLEAKKPAVNIKDDASPAYQLRRYAWSAKLPLSILSNFEETAVYDCRIKPDLHDKASTARVLLLGYEELAERWDELAGIFSREAVLKGSFDKFAESNKRKRGTAEVDAAFLADIEGWRIELAKNLALRNPGLETRDLNFAVQRIIDRVIFLRIAEDRGIEDYGRLQALLNGDRVYPRLGEIFRHADDRYNSGVFHFEPEKGRSEPPDELTLGLALDDKPLKEILRSLYYPDSPYEFSVLSADILGQVYEQFLGKVIKLTAGRRAVVEDKPEVKKAGGVYYTPTYIVDYIVRQTVGKLLEGKTPKQAAKLRILDPACGSGSFLIGAYQFLLDWHLAWYGEHGSKNEVYQDKTGAPRLTIAERKRILLNNIYGVDLDPQAVEVTKLSLLLKVLEGASREALERQRRLFHERALPDLGSNIKCGNSLIGPDFYDGQQAGLFDEEEKYRLNVFDWRGKDGFPQIMKAGGFDAVIGNPPYVRMETFKPLKEYLRCMYATHEERSDLYGYFIEQEHKLLRHGGRFGMIVSNKFLRANYGRPLRKFLRQEGTIEEVIDFAGLPVFPTATVRTIVLVTSRRSGTPTNLRYSPPLPPADFQGVVAGRVTVEEAIQANSFETLPPPVDGASWLFAPQGVSALMTKLRESTQRLFDYCGGKICMGVKSGLTEAFVIDRALRDRLVSRNKKAAEILKPFVNGRDVRRYFLDPPEQFLIYTFRGVPIEKYPQIEKHLLPFKARLQQRATKQKWYELQQPQLRFAEYLNEPKIIFPDLATSPRFALDEAGHYGANTVYFIPGRDLFLLALLNSKLVPCQA